MRIIDNKIVLKTCPCCHCNLGENKTPGLMPSRKRCPKCKGTCRGPRGGRGTCRDCYQGTVTDFDNLITCTACDGKTIVPETLTDSLNSDVWQSLRFEVIREENGKFGFNESYLGLGYVWTCGDYGRSWKESDEAIIEEVRSGSSSSYIQGCKIAKDDLTVCEYIAILVSPSGYKVKAVFAGDNPADNRKANSQVAQMFSH